MPIHIGTSNKNQQQISFGATQMQKVYVGDKLVWQKIPPFTTIKYGLLYNWYAATDSRILASIGWHLPSDAEFDLLITYLSSAQGGKLKETGTTYWISPNSGATNSALFNGRAAGYRDSSTGNFFDGIDSTTKRVLQLRTSNSYTTDNAGGYQLHYNNNILMDFKAPYSKPKKQGMSVRLVKDSTSLTNGQTGTYIGNNGNIYRTICIGTQEWLADNLAETKYRNGDAISEVTSNSAWAALTTGALCAYNNDWSNV